MNGLSISNLGTTFISESCGTESELDHIYWSPNIQIKDMGKLDPGVSDHSPIFCDISTSNQKKTKTSVIKKRSFKNFNVENFRLDLLRTDWAELLQKPNINDQAKFLQDWLLSCLDIHAPIKSFKIKSTYRSGLSYKKIRNKCNNSKRKDIKMKNHKSLSENPSNAWKIANSILKKKNEEPIRI